MHRLNFCPIQCIVENFEHETGGTEIFNVYQNCNLLLTDFSRKAFSY